LKKTYFLYAFILILIGTITWGIYFSDDPKDQLTFEVKDKIVERGLSLQIPLAETNEGRRDFSQEFLKIKNYNELRPLYEKKGISIRSSGLASS